METVGEPEVDLGDDPSLEDYEAICDENTDDMPAYDPTQVFTYYLSFNDVQYALLLEALGYSYNGADDHIDPYADYLVVVDEAGDCGIIEQPVCNVAGEMNYTPPPGKTSWKFDLNGRESGQELDDDEAPRFSGMLYGGRYREFWLYTKLLPSLGLPAERVAYMWLTTDYWGGPNGLKLDYQLHERWKQDSLDYHFGAGNWVAAWEGDGDLRTGRQPSCQAAVDELGCDDTLLDPFINALADPDASGGMIAVLDEYVEGGHEAFFAFWATEIEINQWDGYYSATHNYYIVLLSNGKFTFVHHSLDLTMNQDYDWSDVNLFGYSVITIGCEQDSFGCASAFVDYLEAFNANWSANTETYLAELDELDTFLEGIDMIYSEDPADLRDLKIWITDRATDITEAIALWNECGYSGGGYWWDTGGSFDPCAGYYGDTGPRDTGETDTAGDDTAADTTEDTASDSGG